MHDVVEVLFVLSTEPDTRISVQVVYWGADSGNSK